MQAQTVRIGGIDRPLLWLYVTLVGIGWLMIYAAGYKTTEPTSIFSFGSEAGKQLLFIVACFAMLFVILLTEWSVWRTFAFPIYIATLLLLPGTLIFGHKINGAYAWYQIGGFSLQPAEFAKFGTSLAIATYLGSTGVNLREWKHRLVALGIILLPILIILLQRDTGSALVFFSFLLVLYREGLPPSWYVLGFGTAALVILGLVFEPITVAPWLIAFVTARLIGRFKPNETRPWWIAFGVLVVLTLFWSPLVDWLLVRSNIEPTAVPSRYGFIIIPHVILLAAALVPNYLKKNNNIQKGLQFSILLLVLSIGLVYAANFACYTVLQPHQQQRIKVWLKPAEASTDAAYNSLHSKMAIGSGGLVGKGYLNGNMTNLRYVPEQSTDFIFCTVGEEQGFLGVASVILFFTLLLVRITTIAERQRSNFSRLYAYCIAGIIFVHFLINIGMTMGVFPIIGIPLPFISYGGSSLIGFSLMIGVLLKLDSNRSIA